MITICLIKKEHTQIRENTLSKHKAKLRTYSVIH